MKRQNGYIWKENGKWYGRWREDVIENGHIVRKQRSRILAEVSDRYRHESDVRPLLDEILQPLNAGKVDARSSLSIRTFVEDSYLPYVEDNLKPSSVNGYKKLWKYVSPRIGDKAIRDFRTVDAANLLSALYRAGWSKRSLQHAKSFLSGVFVYAKNVGILDGYNPVKDAILPKKAKGAKETHAITADEVLKMFQAIPDIRARAAIGLTYFAGLRPGEARGLEWEDYDEKLGRIMVRRSVWGIHVTAPKTESSLKPVPVIQPLKTLLSELRAAEGNPKAGFILRGESGKPLNLNNLARRVIKPALQKAQIEWHGYYPSRRGIATLVSTIAKDPQAAKGMLRHSNLSTTLTHYVKDVPEVTQKAMSAVEELFSNCAVKPAAELSQVPQVQ